jgi:hypothetical protein
MRLSRNKKPTAVLDRRDELRKARSEAATLRVACPEAETMRVELEFSTSSGEAHVPQIYSLFPPAKTHFVYPCPYGDCSGVFDLQTVAHQALHARQKRVQGSITCDGARSRDGAAGRPCELKMKYSITLTLERPVVARSG